MSFFMVWQFDGDPDGESAEEVEAIDHEEAAKAYAEENHNELGCDSAYLLDGEALEDLEKDGVLLAVVSSVDKEPSPKFFRVGVVEFAPVFGAEEVHP